MTPVEFAEVQAEFEEFLDLGDENNLDKKVFQQSRYYHKALTHYIVELNILKEYKARRTKVWKEVYHELRFGNNRSFQLEHKWQFDNYVTGHDRYQAIDKLVNSQESVVAYFKGILDAINNLGYAVKNYIEVKKLTQGI